MSLNNAYRLWVRLGLVLCSRSVFLWVMGNLVDGHAGVATAARA